MSVGLSAARPPGPADADGHRGRQPDPPGTDGRDRLRACPGRRRARHGGGLRRRHRLRLGQPPGRPVPKLVQGAHREPAVHPGRHARGRGGDRLAAGRPGSRPSSPANLSNNRNKGPGLRTNSNCRRPGPPCLSPCFAGRSRSPRRRRTTQRSGSSTRTAPIARGGSRSGRPGPAAASRRRPAGSCRATTSSARPAGSRTASRAPPRRSSPRWCSSAVGQPARPGRNPCAGCAARRRYRPPRPSLGAAGSRRASS